MQQEVAQFVRGGEALAITRDTAICPTDPYDRNVVGTGRHAQVPAQFQDHLIHAQLDTKDWTLMASDAIGHPLTHGNDMSIMINCDSEEQINAYYKALSVGGEIVSELKKEFWGAIYANFVDKYGIRWMLNYAQN